MDSSAADHDTAAAEPRDGGPLDQEEKKGHAGASDAESDDGSADGSDDGSDESGGSDDEDGEDGDNTGDDDGSEEGSGEEGSGGEEGGETKEGDEEDPLAGFRPRKRGKKKLRARAARRAAAAGKEIAPTAGKKRKRSEPSAAKSSSKRQTTDIRKFLDIEVEEAGDDEEEGGERLGQRPQSEEAEATEAAYQRIRAENERMREKQAAAKTAEQIAAEIEQRERDTGYADQEEYDEEGGQVQQQALLPDARDPKLWMLKCKEGSETEILITLLNKYIAKAEAGQRLGIMSATCTAKGVIFIESFREAQVREAASSITDLYGWKPDAIKLIPIAQMTDCVKVVNTRASFQKNQFVRMTQGAYKGDLAQVIDVYQGGARLLIRCIPRINMALLGVAKEHRKGFRGSRSQKPPQRLFDRDEIIEASNGAAIIESKMKYGGIRVDVFGTGTYKDGMLLKEVRPIAVNPFQANPTIDEMKRFEPRKSARGDEDETENRLKAADDALHSLSATGPSSRSGNNTTYVSGVASADVGALLPGDNVVVVKGDLSNLQGRVVAVAGNTFTMQPTGETAAELGMTSMLEMPCDEVLKTFEPGHKVRILGGPYIGETGTVVKVLFNEKDGGDLETAWLASILLDSGLKSVQAFVRDLTRTSESRAAISEVEGYCLYDLIEVPGSSELNDSGVIVSLGQREANVMLTSGIVRPYPISQLRGKLNFRSFETHAMDKEGHSLSIGDVVRVTRGAADVNGATGTIKHIVRGYLFLHDFKRPANGGVFVARNRDCEMAGTKVRAPGTINASASIVPMGRGRGRGQVDGMVGKTVRIKAGPHKAKTGVVKSLTPMYANVELHSTQKLVLIKKQDVTEIGDHAGPLPETGGRQAYQAPATPFLGSTATPAYNSHASATPAYGSHAPMTPYVSGSMTPMVGSATPMVGGYGDRTPMHFQPSQTPFYGSRTPMVGAQTPMMGGAQTPLVSGGAGARTPSHAPSGITVAPGEATWCVAGVYVSVTAGMHAGRVGTIHNVLANGASCAVVFADAPGPAVNIPSRDLRPRPPLTHENCRFIKGAYAGQVGSVVSITEGASAAEDAECAILVHGEIDVVTRSAVVACAPPS